jgi:hypothetical protein
MRAARFAAVGLAVVFGVAVLGVWLLPAFMDWGRYRDTVANLASAALGQPVHIDGPVTLTLLPEPVLTAMDVSVGGADNPAVVTARELRLRVALGPLLAGNVDARELVLRGARMQVPWPPVAWAMSFRRPSWLASVSARIEDASVTIGRVAFTGIDATLTLGDPTAAYAAAGIARRDGHTWRFTARVGSSGTDGAATLDVTLDGQGPTQGLGANFSGQLAPDGTLGGKLAVRGPDLSQVLPAPPVAFRAEGRLTVAAGLAEADELALEINGSPAHGAVSLRLDGPARLDLALATSRLDLDAWLPVLLQSEAFPLPVGLDLSAEAAQFSGGLLRRLRATFELSAGLVTVREASAVLPGEASLRVAGVITRTDRSGPHFQGEATLSAPDLRTTLHWLDDSGLRPLDALPPFVLRSAEIAGQITAEPGRILLPHFSGTADNSMVSGRLAVVLGSRLAVSAHLTVDHLVLDPWLPNRLPPLQDFPAALNGFDADLEIEAAHALLYGRAFDTVMLGAAIDDGHLLVRRLDADMRGVHVHLSGAVGDAGRISDANFEVSTADAGALLDFAPPALRFPGLWRGPFRFLARGAGPFDALSLRISVDLADGRLEAQPVIDLSAAKWTGTVTLRHPGAPRLAEMLGMIGAPAWLGDGSLSLVAQISASRGRLAADNFDLGAGALRANGQVTLEHDSGPPRLTGRVVVDTLPLPYLYIRSPDPLPLDWLRGWQGQVHLDAAHVLLGFSPVLEKASATLTLVDGVLRLDPLAGVFSGGALSGSVAVDGNAVPPKLQVLMTLTGATLPTPLADLPVDVSADVVDGSVDLRAEGHSPAALLATLSGSAAIVLHDATISGFDEGKLDAGLQGDAAPADLAATLTTGATRFSLMEGHATLLRGNVTLGNVALSGTSGDAVLSGTIDVAGSAMDLRAVLHPAIPDAPAVAVRLSGAYDDLRRIPELSGITRWRAQAK